MAAETYKLTYFDLRGRGEAARMMFLMAGQEFEDVRIPFSDWPSVKATTPQGFLPILETSEGVISQTIAVSMFVAEKMGFLPESAYERSQTLSLLITLNDVMTFANDHYYKSEVFKLKPSPPNIEEEKLLVQEKVKETIAFIKTITKPDTKFLFGDKITVADLLYFIGMEDMPHLFPDADIGNDERMTNIRNDPKFAEYMEKRK